MTQQELLNILNSILSSEEISANEYKRRVLGNIKKSLVDNTESERMTALRDVVYSIAFL